MQTVIMPRINTILQNRRKNDAVPYSDVLNLSPNLSPLSAASSKDTVPSFSSMSMSKGKNPIKTVRGAINLVFRRSESPKIQIVSPSPSSSTTKSGGGSSLNDDTVSVTETDTLSSENEKIRSALVQAQKDMAAKDAQLTYLRVLVDELKSLYVSKLEANNLELSKARLELKQTRQELSKSKADLTEVLAGQARILDDFSKKSDRDLCSGLLFPSLSPFRFN
jgi:hypothetical protein